MARRTVIDCDFDSQHEATETLVLMLDDEAVEMDACAACAKKARDAVNKVLSVGRPVTLKELAKRGNGDGQEVDTKAVREWCAAQNPPIEVNAKGRVPVEIIEKYLAAHQAESPTN